MKVIYAILAVVGWVWLIISMTYLFVRPRLRRGSQAVVRDEDEQ